MASKINAIIAKSAVLFSNEIKIDSFSKIIKKVCFAGTMPESKLTQ
jgi:hypothetical protein